MLVDGNPGRSPGDAVGRRETPPGDDMTGRSELAVPTGTRQTGTRPTGVHPTGAIRCLFALLAAVVVVATTVAPASAAATGPAGATALLRRAFGSTQAVSVAVARNGTIEYTAALGTLDGHRSHPVTIASRFRIASASKSFAAVAVEQLVAAGRLDLAQPIVSLLPPGIVPPVTDPRLATVTLGEVMSHTGALPAADDLLFAWPGRGACPNVARQALRRRLTGTPGTRFLYSNLGYCLVGLVLQQATGQPFNEAIDDLVLDPAGISGMHIVTTYGAGPGDVHYSLLRGRSYIESLGAAGSWVANPSELVTFIDRLAGSPGGPPLVTRDTLAAMTARPPGGQAGPSWFGLGLMVFDNGATFGHAGSLERAGSLMLHRSDGVTYAVTVAGSSPTAQRLRTVMDALVSVGQF
jgi:D-alanyl-D-alanine carboxypeptidase